MPRSTSTTSFARFASAAGLAAALGLGGVALRDQRADACGWSAPTIEELTTFDPEVAADPAPDTLLFDPYMAGFGAPCSDCGHSVMLDDWDGFLAGAVPKADWEKLLFQASAADLQRFSAALDPKSKRRGAGKLAPLPLGIDVGGWKLSARARIDASLNYLMLARQTEQIAGYDASGAAPADIAKMLTQAKAGLKSAKEAFLVQRYAFQIVRIQFYQHDWEAAVAFFDKNSARLEKPSGDLAWRARYYVAGALRKSGNLARANLELARIHAGSTELRADAAQDFQPMEDADWKATLRLARDVHEQVQLWRLVGIKQDGLTALQEIAKLDPTSDLVGLLVVRELARAEISAGGMWGDTPDAAALAAQAKTYAALEAVVKTIAASKGADRPWLLKLALGHLAARRGDLPAARTQLAAAVAARPGDTKVAAQAKASLALALVIEGKLDAAREDEIAKTMAGLDGFARRDAVLGQVRSRLAAGFLKAGQPVEAEFLDHGSSDALDPATGAPTSKTSRWYDVGFLRQMIARAGKSTTAFDKFVLKDSYTRPDLERELAMRQLLGGDFAGASKTFSSTTASSESLGTDPFVTHIVDCHDCDHDQYASAPWTHASFAAHLAELAKQAGGKGDVAAQAALDLGTGLYNVTWYGNARIVLDGTHQTTSDTAPAERWYKKAFDTAASRELKARAAFYAAKAELGEKLDAAHIGPYDEPDTLPLPSTWYPVIKTFADTAYYKEIIAECGAYRRWAGVKPRHR